MALQFVEKVNAHDVGGLVGLMTPNHLFIDSLGERSNRPAIEDGWKQYFEMVPDYRIEVDRSFRDRDTAILIGRAGGTYVPTGGCVESANRWETPAVWIARIRGKKVAEWRIYSDNEPIRQKMKRTGE